MIENNPSNVSAAFEILLEEIEAEVDFVNRIGARAFEGREHEKAREALERVAALTAFRDKVAALRKEWDAMAAAADRAEDEETRSAIWAAYPRASARPKRPFIVPSFRRCKSSAAPLRSERYWKKWKSS